jgi:hypothetical protein
MFASLPKEWPVVSVRRSYLMQWAALAEALQTEHSSVNTPVWYAWPESNITPTHWPDPKGPNFCAVTSMSRTKFGKNYRDCVFCHSWQSVTKRDNVVCLKAIWLKKHLEYVHNIDYSTYEGFRSLWIKIGRDISTGQKVCGVMLVSSYGICGDLWVSLINGPVRSEAIKSL